LCGDPAQYEWRYLGKQERLVPYDCILTPAGNASAGRSAASLKSLPIRWANLEVMIVEGILHRSESNTSSRRIFYLDEPSWLVVLGEAYDIEGGIQKCYLLDSYLPIQPCASGRWYQL
jgi:hypothetical protein